MAGLEMPPDIGVVATRLGWAVLVGGALGINRDLKNKPAGLRTHALVALAGAILSYTISTWAVAEPNGPVDALSRVVQGIMTGIGFLGAGVIVRSEKGAKVHGLTTAATVWVAAALGIACGIGRWSVVLVTTVLAFSILLLGRMVERLFQGWFGSPDEVPPAG